jgi:hypothetical protein
MKIQQEIFTAVYGDQRLIVITYNINSFLNTRPGTEFVWLVSVLACYSVRYALNLIKQQ